MSQLNVKIITPEKEIFNEAAEQINVPTLSGEIGILPQHMNLMTKIIPGQLTLKQKGKTHLLAAGDGLLQVCNDQVTILTDLAVWEDDIDAKAVEEAKKRAEQALEDKLSDEEYAETMAVIEKSLIQLKVKRRHAPLKY